MHREGGGRVAESRIFQNPSPNTLSTHLHTEDKPKYYKDYMENAVAAFTKCFISSHCFIAVSSNTAAVILCYFLASLLFSSFNFSAFSNYM